MRTRSTEVSDIFFEHAMQQLVGEYQELIQAFAARTAQDAFTDLCWTKKPSVLRHGRLDSSGYPPVIMIKPVEHRKRDNPSLALLFAD